MVSSPLISVIIPVYKVENYLTKCVDSVLNQNFTDIEVILVNDGSPDNCPQICDDYALIDARVKVIHKKNGGLSEARNYGINAASGEYLMFLDSDDYWEGKDALLNIVNLFNKNPGIDVVFHGCVIYNVRTGIRSIPRTDYKAELWNKKSKDDIIKYLFGNDKFPGSAWIVITRRTFIIQNDIFFEVGIKSEDIDWIINVFFQATSFDAVDDIFYVYLKNRENSITNTSDIRSINSILFTLDKWAGLLVQNLTIPSSKYFLNFLSYQYLTCIIVYHKLPLKDKRQAAIGIRKHEYILEYSLMKKAIIAKWIYKIMGISIASKIFTAYYRRG